MHRLCFVDNWLRDPISENWYFTLEGGFSQIQLHVQSKYDSQYYLCLSQLGMGDIDILAYNYCEASISRLSRLLN